MAITKMGLVLALPALIKGSAYLFLGCGAIANSLGYRDIADLMLAISSVMGVGDAFRDARTR